MITTMLIAALLAHAPIASEDAPAIRIVLTNGAVLQGPVAEQTEEAIHIDLGFERLAIPLDQVVEASEATPSVVVDAPSDTPEASSPPVEPSPESDGDGNGEVEDDPMTPYRGRLYRENGGREVRGLDANVDAVGEAVVLVRSPFGLGSGFVIHPEGYVITNDHVIAGTNELTVVIYRQATDGLRKDEYQKVRIVATSSLLDLALIKIEPEEPETFVTVALANSHTITQGEQVFAVGNPFGLERTLSEGIVSLRSRLLGEQTYVQTTAPISPGNSGGPLFNMRGEVIGVNSLKIVAQGADGIGFSIPINRVKAFIDDQEAYAFDPLNANTGFRYNPPPQQQSDAAGDRNGR